MWRERVKRQLQQEKQQWLGTRRAAAVAVANDTSDEEEGTLHFLSISKLLQIVASANGNSTSGQCALDNDGALAVWGIQRVELQPHDEQQVDASSVKKPRYNDGGDRNGAPSRSKDDVDMVNITRQTAYSSDRVWLTGFLRLRDAEKSKGGNELHLCDASDLGCHTLVLNPKPEFVDQLVLVKRWALVDTGASDTTATTSSQRSRFSHLFLEIHDDPPTILHHRQTEDTQARSPTQDEVLRLLDAHYPTQDPPLYTGLNPWRAVVKGRSEPAEQQEPVSKKGKTKKRRRVHAVFGRVVCVSPVSNQQDRSSCHFFAEVEFQNREERLQHIVNIMFVGAQSVRWRLFLRPGWEVLVTDLMKVFSRECGIFLLQTTNADGGDDKPSVEDPLVTPQLGTQVFMWQHENPVLSMRPAECHVHRSTESNQVEQEEETLNCEGVITRVLWNECLEVQSNDPSDEVFVVCLFHFPDVDLGKIRAGATVCILNAHVLRWKTPIDPKVVIGLCARSHLSIVAHSIAPRQCLRPPLPPGSRRHQSKKLSHFGDRHSQPLSVSVWLFEVFEALVNKFLFGSSATRSASLPSALTSFPHVRRREALRIFAEVFDVDVSYNSSSSSSIPAQNSTLGSRFLNSHAEGARNCLSVHAGNFTDSSVMRGQIVAIRDLEKWARLKLAEAFAEEPTTRTAAANGRFCIQVPAEDLNWCLLLGCLNGNVYSGDLEICDRTGSLPFWINRGSQEVKLDPENSKNLYAIRRFELVAEAYCRPGVERDFDNDVVIVSVSCSVDGIERISMGVSECHASLPASFERDLTVLVTHIDPVKRSSVTPDKLRWICPVYRHVHGIAFPDDGEQPGKCSQVPMRVEFLINTNVPHWHVEKYGWYKIAAAICEEDPYPSASERHTASAATIEEKSIILTMQFLLKLMPDNNAQTVCFQEYAAFVNEFDSLYQSMHCNRLKIYRVEADCRIEPLRFEVQPPTIFACSDHDSCAKPQMSQLGLLDFPEEPRTTSFPGMRDTRLHIELLPFECSEVKISSQQLLLFSLLQHFALCSENILQISDLLRHPLQTTHQHQREDNPDTERDQRGILNGGGGYDNDIHRMKLYSIIGVVVGRKYYWVDKPPVPVGHLGEISSKASATTTKKRNFANEQPEPHHSQSSKTRELMCVFHVRDLVSMNAIDVHVNASRFGVQASLQPRSIVEFSKLQGFIARSTYKVYMNWGNCSSARKLHGSPTCKIEAPSDAELYGSITGSALNELYHAEFADRALHRWIVRVVYVSYVVLKRKCRKCHCALQLEKRRACWVHQTSTQPNSKPRKCSWHELHLKDPHFEELTYASMSMRCVIDDGSAQAELFLEKDVAWDLLACSAGARRRFEEIVRLHLPELSYFTGQSSAPNAFFSTSSTSFKDNEYYQNEFRSMIVDAMQSLNSVVVFGQRFYSPPRVNTSTNKGTSTTTTNSAGEREFVSVLTFGKDIQITTKSVASVQIEARRVDTLLQVKSELRQRLARLRASM